MSEAAEPRLMVVVDTEEEFDWEAMPDRTRDSVVSMQSVWRFQEIFDEYGLKPCYVIDHPIAREPGSVAVLSEFLASGRCEIGAHLHPWVNPPYGEPLSRRNTYPGNLEAPLEEAKLRCLRDLIKDAFGVQPRIYKAGRYGFGANTARLLEELGFDIDLSVCPPLDSSADGGPDYSSEGAEPFWFGEHRRLLEIPMTGAFVGWGGRLSRPLFSFGQRLSVARMPGILARLGAVDRLILSPEGFTPEEHRRLTRFLLERGSRVFTWSLHSPSAAPGHTPYVANERDLERFLDSFRRFFDYFFSELGGQPTTPGEIRELLLETRQ